MNTILKQILILFIIAGFVSCDDKIRELEDLNTPSQFQYFIRQSVDWENAIPDQVINDSAKIYNKYNNSTYPAIVHIYDRNYNLNKVTIKNSNPDLSFFVNDETYYKIYEISGKFPEKYNLAFRNNKESVESYLITAVDDFGAENTLTFNITYVPNKPPVPNFTMILKNGKENWYKLEGEKSYDADRKLGGRIVEYEYIIDDVIISTSQPSIMHIFKPGIHTVKFRCKDNDNVWSDYITQEITIK